VVAHARVDVAICWQCPANTGRDRSLLDPIVRPLSVALEPRGARGVVDELIPTTEPDPLAQGAVVPDLRRSVRRERPGATLRDDVHDAPDGVCAIDRRLRAAHDLDPVDLIG